MPQVYECPVEPKSLREKLAPLPDVVIALPFVLYKSFVLTKLWAWFFVPLGLRPISLAWAVGIVTTVVLVSPGQTSDARAVRKYFKIAPDKERQVVGYFMIALLFLIGWTAHRFM